MHHVTVSVGVSTVVFTYLYYVRLFMIKAVYLWLLVVVVCQIAMCNPVFILFYCVYEMREIIYWFLSSQVHVVDVPHVLTKTLCVYVFNVSTISIVNIIIIIITLCCGITFIIVFTVAGIRLVCLCLSERMADQCSSKFVLN